MGGQRRAAPIGAEGVNRGSGDTSVSVFLGAVRTVFGPRAADGEVYKVWARGGGGSDRRVVRWDTSNHVEEEVMRGGGRTTRKEEEEVY